MYWQRSVNPWRATRGPRAGPGPSALALEQSPLSLLHYSLMSGRFTRTKEDFICSNCRASVAGNGYTNHCPVCLCSLHVDVNPGDRMDPCHGLMEPIKVERDHGDLVITHRCQKCAFERRNRASTDDNFEKLISLMNP